jgi:hypothetical protein
MPVALVLPMLQSIATLSENWTDMDWHFKVWSGFLAFPNIVRPVMIPVYPKKA